MLPRNTYCVKPWLGSRQRSSTSARAGSHPTSTDETTAATKAALAYFKQKGWASRLIARPGIPGDEIAKAAESGKFDLVVMGSHGHSALGALFMGSTAQRVLAKCSTPVLLIRQ